VQKIETTLLGITVVAIEAMRVEERSEIRCDGRSRDENKGKQQAKHGFHG
jgi:hypothetical protein